MHKSSRMAYQSNNPPKNLRAAETTAGKLKDKSTLKDVPTTVGMGHSHHRNIQICQVPHLALPSCGRRSHISPCLEVAGNFWCGFSLHHMVSFNLKKACHPYFFFPSSSSFIRSLGGKSSLFLSHREPKHFRKIEFKIIIINYNNTAPVLGLF